MWTKTAGALAGAAGHLVGNLPGIAGAALVSAGGWMVYHPAGMVAAGVFCLLADWRHRP